MKRVAYIVAVAALVAPAYAREKQESDAANTLTHGMVQMTLNVGQTTQAEILESFGGPNITSIDGSGQEMWVYDRHATVTSDSSSGFSIGMLIGAAGGAVGGGAGLGFGKKKSKSSQSSRSMTLIIKFDKNKIVSDFNTKARYF
ncbi:hypothetical protein [Sphingorhabdus sp.]|jgi:hypothetical protein|uniref:hypothetical protein n=1 Tax=Sphingorhabdus sp. TaxID=1902408 RepID=UPI0037C7A417